MSEETSIQIVENYEILAENKIIIQAFTGSGLVASIVAHHLIEKLDLKEKGYISSPLIPAVGIVRNGIIQRPIRIFENNEYLLILSEIGISQDNLNEFIESLFIWYNSIDPSSIVVIGALPTGRPSDATDLRYSVVASDSITQQYIEEKDVTVLPQGAVYGSVALSLMEAKRYGISSFGILSNCIATIPDYLAAKKVVEILQILLEESIPTEPLNKNALELKEHLIRRDKNKLKTQKGSTNDDFDLFSPKFNKDPFYDDSDDDEDLSKFI
ncbi:MAG: hypothetical protein HeimC2_27030 [Candidatus Heimdallarchaeota archaeon LC_2]|nr:MAG: hypothetical protein HeimC2_27030 [Candidatus Heimdallarchaeota archaeon LC_2]